MRGWKWIWLESRVVNDRGRRLGELKIVDHLVRKHFS